jgi:hypothetical protein
MEGLDKGGQGPTSGCCAIEEEDEDGSNVFPQNVGWLSLDNLKTKQFLNTAVRTSNSTNNKQSSK